MAINIAIIFLMTTTLDTQIRLEVRDYYQEDNTIYRKKNYSNKLQKYVSSILF